MAPSTRYRPIPIRGEDRSRALIYTVAAVMSSGLITANTWAVVGYSAVILPQVTNTNSTLQLTSTQASWFATLPLFMCIPLSTIGGLISEWLGPRRSTLILSPLVAASFVVMHLASWKLILEAEMAYVILMICRVVQGVLLALHASIPSVYICDISDSSHRGMFTSLLEPCIALGFVLCYLLGGYVHWYTAAWLLPLITSVPGFLGFLIAPESPPWLVRKGKEAEAMTTLLRLRGSSEEAEQEVALLKECVKMEQKHSFCQSVRLLKERSIVIPMAISALVIVFKELCGLSVIMIYMVRIFQLAGVGFNPFWISAVVSSVRLACNLLGSGLVHRFPRKECLLGGIICTAVGMTTVGTFFFLQSRKDDLSHLGWLPVAGFIVLIVGMGVSVYPVSWLIAAEVLPGAVSFLGMGVSVTGHFITSFLISKTFDDVTSLIGLHGLFWSYALACVTFSLFVIIFVPETRGRSQKEIEEIWVRSSGEKQLSDRSNNIKLLQKEGEGLTGAAGHEDSEK
ncbi:trehalose transporter 1-like protein isoform X2 [Panulirus ornatus]|uniref:trehalose transporter 1-like protein isoform X2 n=1 Tax=Panulirus ornatus TaxID=150431 RepID=UPI003A83E1E1